MDVTSLHVLLTYQCTLECDHCFVWGSPWQRGTLTQPQVTRILRAAQDARTVRTIYFEGGEPFLYYVTLLHGVREAARAGFRVGLVSNGYWATSPEDARACLEPFAGLVELEISSDSYHCDTTPSEQARNATAAAAALDIPVGIVNIAPPDASGAACSVGQLPAGDSELMLRGRAAGKLSARARGRSWDEFTSCPHEDLRAPGRVHVDPLGTVQLCQGISLGNLFEQPLRDLCARYDPASHPVAGPLLEGGPARLVRTYELSHDALYADACHLCYEARRKLRPRFPAILQPDQMYGVFECSR